MERRAYDMILMDCQMPEMDAYEARTEIRLENDARHIPNIAMTASAMEGGRGEVPGRGNGRLRREAR